MNAFSRIEDFWAAAQSIRNPELSRCCADILSHHNFTTSPAAAKHHHVYKGGLIDHTLEVLNYASTIANLFPQVNMDVLTAAALWHDMAKIWEYERISKTEWGKTSYAERIYHVNGSAAEFTSSALLRLVPRSTIHEVQHCILAHHGRKDWGSSVEPQTLEALILHQADMLSCRFGATKNGVVGPRLGDPSSEGGPVMSDKLPFEVSKFIYDLTPPPEEVSERNRDLAAQILFKDPITDEELRPLHHPHLEDDGTKLVMIVTNKEMTRSWRHTIQTEES